MINLKLYISTDIEGICGVTSWSETELNHRDSIPFIKQWHKEINTVIDVAVKNGYDEIYVKDAHDTARNLLPDNFPEQVKLIRGWSGHPYGMVEGLDSTFDAAIFVGYHSKAYSNGNPISHTLQPKTVRSIKVNGELASEFLFYYYACLYEKVPVIMITGDLGICNDVKEINKDILTVTTKEGFSGATINYNPLKVLDDIKHGAQQAFDSSYTIQELPDKFDIEISFSRHEQAYKASFYKGTTLLDDGYTITYSTDDFFEVLRCLIFIIR